MHLRQLFSWISRRKKKNIFWCLTWFIILFLRPTSCWTFGSPFTTRVQTKTKTGSQWLQRLIWEVGSSQTSLPSCLCTGCLALRGMLDSCSYWNWLVSIEAYSCWTRRLFCKPSRTLFGDTSTGSFRVATQRQRMTRFQTTTLSVTLSLQATWCALWSSWSLWVVSATCSALPGTSWQPLS